MDSLAEAMPMLRWCRSSRNFSEPTSSSTEMIALSSIGARKNYCWNISNYSKEDMISTVMSPVLLIWPWMPSQFLLRSSTQLQEPTPASPTIFFILRNINFPSLFKMQEENCKTSNKAKMNQSQVSASAVTNCLCLPVETKMNSPSHLSPR